MKSRALSISAACRAALVVLPLCLLAPGPAPAAPLVSAPFPLAATTGREFSFSAAFDGTNWLAAILGTATQDDAVTAQLVSQTGAMVGGRIATGRTGSIPVVAFDGTNYLMAWEDSAGGVYGQFVGTGGALSGSPFEVAGAGATVNMTPGLAYGGGYYLVTYYRVGAGDFRTLHGRTITPSGTLGSELTISSDFKKDGGNVAFDGTNFFTVWTAHDNTINKGRSVHHDGTLGTEVLVNLSSAPSDNPSTVAFDGTNYLAVWMDEVGERGWNLYGQKITTAGVLSGGVITITEEPGTQFLGSLTFDGTDWLVVWTDMVNDADGNGVCGIGEGSCHDAYGQVLSREGVLVGSKFPVSVAAGDQFAIAAGFAAGKHLTLVNNPEQLFAGLGGDVSGVFITPETIISDDIVLPTPWVGSVSITADKNVVAVGRPHIGAEVASYDGFSSGATTAYLPMLFKNAWGAYNSAFYVQNVHAFHPANLTITYYDSTGTLNCTVLATVAPLASNGYWVPDQDCLPDGWVGGVVVTSDQPVVAIGRPHIGAEVMSYNGFASGSLTSYLPMLFKDAFGGSYDSAFYVQNVHASTATITMEFYDNLGALSCTRTDTVAPRASKGYWLPSESCLTSGWVGGVVVSSDQPIVTVGRPHVGNQITTYDGFTSGDISSYVPMLFKGAFGGSYDSAFYIQNVNDAQAANLVITFHDSAGNLSCTINDTLAALASKGYWVPSQGCLPAGWVGGVVVSSDQPVVAVGRPHIGTQVTTYNGFTSGSASSFLPMLFKAAFGGSYNSAFYIQNTEASAAAVTIRFYDTGGALTCTRGDTIPALASLGLWVPGLTCSP